MSDQSSEKEFVCFTCLSLFSNAELVRVNGAEYCHTCAVEVLLDENERLSEGWMFALCRYRKMLEVGNTLSCCPDCEALPIEGKYCQAVRDVVDGREG